MVFIHALCWFDITVTHGAKGTALTEVGYTHITINEDADDIDRLICLVASCAEDFERQESLQ